VRAVGQLEQAILQGRRKIDNIAAAGDIFGICWMARRFSGIDAQNRWKR